MLKCKMSFVNGSVTVVKGSLPMFLPKLTTDLFGTNGFTTPLSFQTLYQNRPFPGPRVGALLLIWESLFILMQITLIFTRKVVHPASF